MIEALDLALGVSSGATARPSRPDPKLDTLRGHSPPMAHGVPRLTPVEASATGKGSTQVIATDPTLLGSNQAVASRTLDRELAPKAASRAPFVFAAGAGLIFLVGGSAFLLGKRQAAGAPSAPATASRAAGTSPLATNAARAQPELSAALLAPPIAAPADGAASSASSATSRVELGNPHPTKPDAATVNAAGGEKSAAEPQPVKAQASAAKSGQRAGKAAGSANVHASEPARNTSTDIGF